MCRAPRIRDEEVNGTARLAYRLVVTEQRPLRYVSRRKALLALLAIVLSGMSSDRFATAQLTSCSCPRGTPTCTCGEAHSSANHLDGRAASPFSYKALGDWRGRRSWMAQHGISLDVMATQFYHGVAQGGLDEEFEYGGKGDYFLNVDGDKAGLWQGFFVTLHGETRFGQDANAADGALSPTNTAMLFPAANEHGTALTGVKLTQALSENFVVFAGKLNTVDEYLHPFAAGRGVDHFMNSALVLPPILARTVPYSTLGAGFAVLAEGFPVLSVSVFDPSSPATESGFDTLFEEGTVLSPQVTLPIQWGGRPGFHSLTGVWSSAEYASIDPTDFLNPIQVPIAIPRESGSWALHYSTVQYLVVDRRDPKQGWGLFAQASISDGNPNPVRWYASAGLGGTTVGGRRPRDRFGVGYYFLGISDELQRLLGPVLPIRDEQGVEAFYNVALRRGWYVTPNLQVIDPFRLGADSVVACGLRVKVDF